MIIRRFAPVIIAVLLLASCAAQAGMSLDEYGQLAEGISYETAALIAGGGGELLPGSTGPGCPIKYTWRGYGDRDASATLEFRDGLLASKTQQGLWEREALASLSITYDDFIDGFLQTAIYSAGGMSTGALSLDSYDYEPRSGGEALRTYTVWQSPEGGFVRLQALCGAGDEVISIETVYDSIAGNPEADSVYLKCTAYSVHAYIMARYSFDIMDADLAILYESMLSQGCLGFAEITESTNGAVSTYRIASGG